MEQLTKHQIIDETVEYYSNNPRALDGVYCAYLTEDGRVCAHSRCLTDEARNIIMDSGRKTIKAALIIEDLGDTIHKEQYRGHEKRFWGDLQSLHDYSNHWTENGLSEDGKITLNELKERWKN